MKTSERGVFVYIIGEDKNGRQACTQTSYTPTPNGLVPHLMTQSHEKPINCQHHNQTPSAFRTGEYLGGR
jgi:hypothetical protein